MKVDTHSYLFSVVFSGVDWCLTVSETCGLDMTSRPRVEREVRTEEDSTDGTRCRIFLTGSVVPCDVRRDRDNDTLRGACGWTRVEGNTVEEDPAI